MTPKPARGAAIRMADVARAVGVSAMTVSRAFKGDESVNPQTRDRILRKAEELGYVFDARAANLRQNRTGFVAVTVPALNSANFAETVRALTEGLAREGLQILLANTEYDPVEEEAAIAQLLRRKPEAVVLTGGQHTPRTRQMLAASGLPIVQLWDLPENPLNHVVGFSNAASIGLLVEHLVARGRRRIGFLGGDSERDPRGRQRRAGFVAAMARHGLGADRLAPLGEPPIAMAAGAQALDALLARYPDTDAVIGVSDLVAFGALAECQRRGIEVPGALALAGFGNYEIGAVCAPRLTTVDVHAGRIGAEAAMLVAGLLNGQAAHPPRRVVLPPELIIRETTPALR
ncbi:MAG: LacI family gluconate utilization system Gnt-I transcriptional repressor [Limimaricola cinnabarinus]|jgi:LacI family gluconate utilization system Gnt-I transcriptional repressor|uniref:LacI family DNA-binding transcriptional regulator n=1 Tax=Limimaricola cinnabarinus TaxID=1125964 RepID=UPI0039E651F9